MNKRFLKRVLSLSVTAVMAASALAGCGGSSPGAQETASSGEDKSVTAETAVSETSEGGTTKLTFWTWIPTEAQWDNIYAAFREENPDIEIEFWRTSNQDDYQKKLQVAIASGTGPDLFGLQPGSLLEQYAKFCEPMDTLTDTYMQGWEGEISQAAISQSTVQDGTVAGMPLLLAGQEFMLYNETLMKECGVESVPTTYEELLAAADKIKAAGKVPMAMGASDVWHAVDWFVAVSQQFGKGKIYEAEQGKLPWTDQVFVDTMNAWVQFFQDGVFEDGALGISTYPDCRDQYFFDREAVFFPTGSWHVGATSKNFTEELNGTKVENDSIGMTIFPQVGPQEAVATTGVDYIISVNKDSAQKEAAAKFVEFMAKGTGQQLWINTLQGSPVAKSITFNGETDSELAQESIDIINEYNNKATDKRKLDYSELETALGIAMQDAAAGAEIMKVLQDVQAVSDGIER